MWKLSKKLSDADDFSWHNWNCLLLKLFCNAFQNYFYVCDCRWFRGISAFSMIDKWMWKLNIMWDLLNLLFVLLTLSFLWFLWIRLWKKLSNFLILPDILIVAVSATSKAQSDRNLNIFHKIKAWNSSESRNTQISIGLLLPS